MRRALLIGLLANMALNIVSASLMPPRVAIHFGAGGVPNSWAGRWTHAAVMGGISALMWLMFRFLPRLIERTPVRCVNLPHREYWLAPARRAETLARIGLDLEEMGVATMAFLFVIGLLVAEANLLNDMRLRVGLFWWPFGLYMGYTALWTVRLIAAFRLRPDAGTMAEQ